MITEMPVSARHADDPARLTGQIDPGQHQPAASAKRILPIRTVRIVLIAIIAWHAAVAQSEDRFGLFVGVNRYSPSYGASPLGACVSDAEGFRAALLKDAYRWNAAQADMLADYEATKATIVQRLRDMATQAGPGDVCVYFQSSHGGTYGGTRTFLCTNDSNFDDEELGEELANFDPQTTVIVIIDACFSGGLFKNAPDGEPASRDAAQAFTDNAMAALRTAKAARAAKMGVPLPKDLGGNIGFITACDYDETCVETARHGLFTGHLIDALSFADADANADENCSFQELCDWAAPRASAANPGQTAQTYNPSLLEATIAGDAGSIISPTDDDFEENDNMESAAVISIDSYELMGLDTDWYVVACDSGRLSVDLAGPDGDLDLYVLNAHGDILKLSQNVDSNESVTAEVATETVYVLVHPYEEQTSSYVLTLRLAVEAEPTVETVPAPDPEPDTSPLPDALSPMPCGFGAPMAAVGSMIGWAGLVSAVRRRR